MTEISGWCCRLVSQNILSNELINEREEDSGITPLVEACHLGHTKCILYLLSNGANPNEAKENEHTPFDILCSKLQPVLQNNGRWAHNGELFDGLHYVYDGELFDCAEAMIDNGAILCRNEDSPFNFMHEQLKKKLMDYYENHIAYDVKQPY